MLNTAAVAVAALGAQRLAEVAHARRNGRRLRAAGAVETGAGHHPVMVGLHTAWLAGTLVEAGSDRCRPLPLRLRIGATVVFAAAQALRYWAIRSLGERWTTRILVPPDSEPVADGPYRFISHPNYVAVAAEIAAFPLVFGARRTALAGSIGNAALMAVRIPAESAALRRP